MVAPRVVAVIIIVHVTMIVISVTSVAIIVNTITNTVIVTDVSINKVFLQANFEGRKRRTILYITRYTVPEFWTIYPDHFTPIIY